MSGWAVAFFDRAFVFARDLTGIGTAGFLKVFVGDSGWKSLSRSGGVILVASGRVISLFDGPGSFSKSSGLGSKLRTLLDGTGGTLETCSGGVLKNLAMGDRMALKRTIKSEFLGLGRVY